MYKVIVKFNDLQDGRHAYKVGDEFPRPGLKVDKNRFEELSTNKNRRGIPLIEKIAVPRAKAKKEVKKNDSDGVVQISE